MEVTAQDCRDVLLGYCAVALKAVVQRGSLEHALKNDLFLICLVPRPGGRVFPQRVIKRTVTAGEQRGEGVDGSTLESWTITSKCSLVVLDKH